MTAGVVLAGGAGRRMGGADKATLDVAGITMLDRVLGAARPLCEELVVVGPPRPTTVAGVRFVQEADVGGGPVPAVGAGLAATTAEVVLVLAVDLPLIVTADLRRLLEALGEHGMAAAAMPNGGANPLLAVYRRGAIDLAGLGAGDRADQLLPGDTVVVELGDRATHNVNTLEGLNVARRLLEGA